VIIIIYVIAIYCIILLFDIPSIVKKESQKTLIVYLVVIGMGFTINILQIKNKLPINMSPSKIIEKVVRFVGGDYAE